MMEYICAEIGDFNFSRFGFIMRTDRQNHITEADQRYTLVLSLIHI